MGGFALIPQVVDIVKLPVIAVGGIADGRGLAAAFALGAEGVQIGTAFPVRSFWRQRSVPKRSFIVRGKRNGPSRDAWREESGTG